MGVPCRGGSHLPPQREWARKRDRRQTERGKDEVEVGGVCVGLGGEGWGEGERVFPTKQRGDVRDPLRKGEKKRLDLRKEGTHTD